MPVGNGLLLSGVLFLPIPRWGSQPHRQMPAKPLRNRPAPLGYATEQVLQPGFTASSAGLAREITTEFERDALTFGA